jgi:hypothetical protein
VPTLLRGDKAPISDGTLKALMTSATLANRRGGHYRGGGAAQGESIQLTHSLKPPGCNT